MGSGILTSSASGVMPGLLVSSMADLKDCRGLLERFDPPAVTPEGEDECNEDNCEIDWDAIP